MKNKLMRFYCTSHLFIVLLITFILTACLNKGNDSYTITIDYKGDVLTYPLPYRSVIEIQNKKERVWKKLSVEEIYNVSDGLFMPTKITLKGSTVYILDPSDGYVKVIDRESESVRKIGPGKGNGPGEVSYPFDFGIDDEGNFILMDINKRALIAWDDQGLPIHDYFFKHATPTTLTSAGKKRVVVMVIGGSNSADFDNKGLFQLYDINENKLSLYSEFVTNTEHLPPLIGLERAFTGRIIFDNQKLIFFPKHLSHIIFISQNGEIDLVRKTIDDVPIPAIIRSEGAGQAGLISYTTLADDVKTANLDGFLVDDSLVIWSRPGLKKYGVHVFDFYDRKHAEYKFSVKMPQLGAAAGIAFNENYIAAIQSDQSISLWEYSVIDKPFAK